MLRSLSAALAVAVLATASHAGSVAVTAVDRSKDALANVVVSATPLDAPVPPRQAAAATIEQKDFDFVPAVTVVRSGTRIGFPNRDRREHHLKSSGAMALEYRIYDAQSTPEPMLFDRTGTTVLFCYLHDWMKAYIHVVDTPWFAKTGKAGVAVIEELPEGRYRIVAWHPDLVGDPLAREIAVSARGTTPVAFAFDLRPRHIGRIRPEGTTTAPLPTGGYRY